VSPQRYHRKHRWSFAGEDERRPREWLTREGDRARLGNRLSKIKICGVVFPLFNFSKIKICFKNL
jgi:hypothetical protein